MNNFYEFRVYNGKKLLYSFLAERDATLDAQGLLDQEDIYDIAEKQLKLLGKKSWLEFIKWSDLRPDGSVSPNATIGTIYYRDVQ